MTLATGHGSIHLASADIRLTASTGDRTKRVPFRGVVVGFDGV